MPTGKGAAKITCILEQLGLKMMGERRLEVKESNMSLMCEFRHILYSKWWVKEKKEVRFVQTFSNVTVWTAEHCASIWVGRRTEEGTLRLPNQADAFPKCSTVILPQLGSAHRKQMEVINLVASWTLWFHWAVSKQAHPNPDTHKAHWGWSRAWMAGRQVDCWGRDSVRKKQAVFKP